MSPHPAAIPLSTSLTFSPAPAGWYAVYYKGDAPTSGARTSRVTVRPVVGWICGDYGAGTVIRGYALSRHGSSHIDPFACEQDEDFVGYLAPPTSLTIIPEISTKNAYGHDKASIQELLELKEVDYQQAQRIAQREALRYSNDATPLGPATTPTPAPPSPASPITEP